MQTVLDSNATSQVCHLTSLNLSPSHSKTGEMRVSEVFIREGDAGGWLKKAPVSVQDYCCC